MNINNYQVKKLDTKKRLCERENRSLESANENLNYEKKRLLDTWVDKKTQQKSAEPVDWFRDL